MLAALSYEHRPPHRAGVGTRRLGWRSSVVRVARIIFMCVSKRESVYYSVGPSFAVSPYPVYKLSAHARHVAQHAKISFESSFTATSRSNASSTASHACSAFFTDLPSIRACKPLLRR